MPVDLTNWFTKGKITLHTIGSASCINIRVRSWTLGRGVRGRGEGFATGKWGFSFSPFSNFVDELALGWVWGVRTADMGKTDGNSRRTLNRSQWPPSNLRRHLRISQAIKYGRLNKSSKWNRGKPGGLMCSACEWHYYHCTSVPPFGTKPPIGTSL